MQNNLPDFLKSKLKYTDELAQNTGINVLVYGKSGVGKTMLCASCPSVMIISFEKGLLSLREYSIPVIEIVATATETVSSQFSAVCNSIANDTNFPYKTVCIDSLTELAEVLLREYKVVHKDPRQAYFAVQEAILSFIKDFSAIPHINCYFIAQEGRVVDEADNGRVYFGPDFPGKKTGPKTPYLVDLTFRFVAIQEQQKDGSMTTNRYLVTKPTQNAEGKDRTGMLDFYEQPDLGAIFEKIKGFEKEKTA